MKALAGVTFAALILAGIAVQAFADTPAASDSLVGETPIVWGAGASDMQCGLKFNAAPIDFKMLSLMIKNTGQGPIRVYEDTLNSLVSGFSLHESQPNQPKIGQIASSGRGDISVGPGAQRLVDEILPGASLRRGFQFGYDPRLGHGSYAILFTGTVQPIGSAQPIKLSCGPLEFKT